MIRNRKIKGLDVSKNVKYFLAILIVYLLFKITSATIATYIDPTLTDSPYAKYGLVETFILLVVVAPLVETMLYQFAIIEILLKIRTPPWWCIIISALVFGFSHWYNFAYVVVTFVDGLMLAYYYFKLRPQNYTNKVLWVMLLHASANIVAYVYNHVWQLG